MGSGNRPVRPRFLRSVGMRFIRAIPKASAIVQVLLYILCCLLPFSLRTLLCCQSAQGIPRVSGEGLPGPPSGTLSSFLACTAAVVASPYIHLKRPVANEGILSPRQTHKENNSRLHGSRGKYVSSSRKGDPLEKRLSLYSCRNARYVRELYRGSRHAMNGQPERIEPSSVPSFVSFPPCACFLDRTGSLPVSPTCHGCHCAPSSSTSLSSSDRLTSAYPSIVSKTPREDTSRAVIPPPESFPLYPPPRAPHRGVGDVADKQHDRKPGKEGPAEKSVQGSRDLPRRRGSFGSWTETRATFPLMTNGSSDQDLRDESRKRNRKQHHYGLGRYSPIVSPAQQKLLKLADNKDRSGSFFVAHLGGTQTVMERGRFYDLNRIHQREGGLIHLHRIVCYQAPDGEFWLGRPYLENVRVTALVEKHFRGPKMYMAKARPKKWRKYFSHRQDMTRIRIQEVELLRNAGEVECASVPPNFTTDNPVYSALVSSKHYQKPSTFMPRMKTMFMRLAPRDELRLLGDDPLTNYDPVVNQLLMDRLFAGHTELFPFLRPGKD